MIKTIGIRREDKNEWERRVPLVPADVSELRARHGIKTIIQPSEIRIFSDGEYRNAGAEINENLQAADVVFAVKEIPLHMLEQGQTYLFFSHTIKGQPYNMEMLKTLIERKCTLIDYELIAGRNNNRLITFSGYAGLAGMIESLHAFGKKMQLKGYETPFSEILQAYQYASLEDAKKHICQIGEMIAQRGFPQELAPLTVGFLGYGNVSKGAQEMFDLLPVTTIEPDQLVQMAKKKKTAADNHTLLKVVFKEEDIVHPLHGAFTLQEYFDYPERFVPVFDRYLPYLNILVNCVYWTEKYPRFVSKEDLRANIQGESAAGIQLIGDISCDIDGSIEITRKSTKPDQACYTYNTENDSFIDGIDEGGVTVMAVDNLPCEFPLEASNEFSKELKTFVNDIVTADFTADFDAVKLPYEIQRAVILYNGSLTEKYEYMKNFL